MSRPRNLPGVGASHSFGGSGRRVTVCCTFGCQPSGVRVQMARTPDEAAPAPQGNHPSENGDDMDEIEQLRSDLENAVLERDKALAEATGILQALDATTAENLRMRDECARLLAELDMFRPVQIRAFTGDTMLVRWLDSDNKSELVSIPLKVFVKDDHV